LRLLYQAWGATTICRGWKGGDGTKTFEQHCANTPQKHKTDHESPQTIALYENLYLNSLYDCFYPPKKTVMKQPQALTEFPHFVRASLSLFWSSQLGCSIPFP